MKWQPWKDHKDKPVVILDIPEPPCKHCVYWKPHTQYQIEEKGFRFDGVKCCIARKMFSDFSCYRDKEDA